MIDLRADANSLAVKFVSEWGMVRRFLSSHPLTGAWTFLAVGMALGYALGKLI